MQITVALALDSEGESLFDDFEYVMYGRLFKYGEGSDQSQIALYASFGGLMLQLNVSPKVLNPQTFSVNDQLYILLKKNH
jgi:DNA-directed RNA polymerase I, II, and III subunit RPABC3